MNNQPASRWPAIIVIYCLSIASAMTVSEGVPALGAIAGEFHPHAPAIIGLVMSAPALVVAIGGLVTGWVVDMAGDRRLLLSGGIVMMLGDVGTILSPSIGSLLACRVIGGIGYLLMAVAAVTMVTRITQGRARVAALALWSTVIPASFIAAFLFGALFLGLGWRWIFGMHAAASLILLALGAAVLPGKTPGDAVVSRTRGVIDVLRSPAPYALGFSFAAAAFVQSGMIAVLAQLLAAKTGASEAQVQSFGILAMLFNMGGAFAVGALLNRGVAAWAIGALGIVLAGASTLTLAMLVSDLATAIAVNCALMLGCGLLAGLWALLPRVAPSPQSIGATSGLITQITLIGVLFGPPCAFAAFGAGPIGFVLLVVVLLLGTAGAVPIWLKKSSQEPFAGAARAPATGALH